MAANTEVIEENTMKAFVKIIGYTDGQELEAVFGIEMGSTWVEICRGVIKREIIYRIVVRGNALLSLNGQPRPKNLLFIGEQPTVMIENPEDLYAVEICLRKVDMDAFFEPGSECLVEDVSYASSTPAEFFKDFSQLVDEMPHGPKSKRIKLDIKTHQLAGKLAKEKLKACSDELSALLDGPNAPSTFMELEAAVRDAATRWSIESRNM